MKAVEESESNITEIWNDNMPIVFRPGLVGLMTVLKISLTEYSLTEH